MLELLIMLTVLSIEVMLGILFVVLASTIEIGIPILVTYILICLFLDIILAEVLDEGRY